VRDFWIPDRRNRCNHLETMSSAVMSYIYCYIDYIKRTSGTDAFLLPLVVAFSTFAGTLDVATSSRLVSDSVPSAKGSNPCVFLSVSGT